MLSIGQWHRTKPAKTVSRFAVHHPLISLIIFIATAGIVMQLIVNAQDRAYYASPEGKAVIARLQAKTDREMAAKMDNFRIDEDLAGLKVYLRDPESAQFTGTRHFQKDGKEITCGRVNSRNGFGGMTGPQSFAVIGLQDYIEGTSREANTLIAKYC